MKADDEAATATTDGTTRPVPAWVGRIAGVALLVLGVPLAALACLGVYRLLAFGFLWLNDVANLNPPPSPIGVLILVLIAVFCCVVGTRLMLQRPNRYRSILPPGGWIAIGVAFVLVGVMVFEPARQKGDTAALIFPFLLAAGSFTMAWRIRDRAPVE